MLAPQSVVIELEGFSFGKHAFIVEEISVRVADYLDFFINHRILPFSYTQSAENLRVGHKGLAGLQLGLGFLRLHISVHLSHQYQVAFPHESRVLSKRLDKCNFLQKFVSHVIDKKEYNCPKASEFPRFHIFVRVTEVFPSRPLC